MNKLFLLVLITLGISGFAIAEVTVIANSGLNMTNADVKDVFIGEKSSLGGAKLVLSDNKSALDVFCQKALGMDSTKYSSLWAKKSFRDGAPAPKSKSSDNEVIDFVKSTAGGVGYLSGVAPAGVTVVGKF